MPIFEDKKEITAFFSTKAGSNPQSPYDNKEVLSDLHLNTCQLIWPQQVHEAHIEIIREKAENNEPIRLPQTDGLVTNQPEILLTTVHADCLAVFFYDKNRKAIGLVHAGWRGTVKGIAVKAVKTLMEEYGSKPADIMAYISPGISQCCFETGTEVYEEFLDKWPWVDEFAIKKGEKYFLDLKSINKKQLLDMGLTDIQISSYCTCCNPELFCSYRGENGTKQRMGAGICLNR